MAHGEPAPGKNSLATLRERAATDSDGGEKKVLSLHDHLFARVLAPPVAWVFLRLGCSADGVTLLSLLTGFAGAASFACGCAHGDLAAILLLQCSYLLDCVDGDIARARGTASLDGYLRDTFRHQLLPSALFIGLTFGVLTRHGQWWIILAGLLGAAFGTRLVGGLDDQVTLEGLSKPALAAAPGALATADRQPLEWLRTRLLPDFAQMNWLTLALGFDLLWLRPAKSAWLAVDYAFLFLSGAQFILKTGGLLLLWRRGVMGRVAKLRGERGDA